MADLERGLKISELTTAEEVSSSDYVAIDNGLNTFKVPIANLNRTGAETASHYADLAEASATDAQSSATSAATSAQSANSAVTLATTQLQSYVTAAETAATEAATSEANARAYASSDYVKKAKSWAVGGTDSRTGEDTDNAKYYSIVSGSCMHIAGESKDTAVASAASAVIDSLKSEGFAVGEQNGEPVSQESPYYNNSSKYWAGVSRAAAVGSLHPMGTCTFEMLPSIADSSLGDMWDISNDFVTTSDFREGAGVQHYAGDNVYLTASDKWDVMAGNISSKQNRVLASTLSIGGQTITEVEPALHALSNGVADTQISTTTFTSSDNDATTDKTNAGFTGYKNLIPYPYYHSNGYETNGITFTVNADGSVTANGTATANADFACAARNTDAGIDLKAGKRYTLSGCPSGGSNSTYACFINETLSGSATGIAYDYGDGATFTLESVSETFYGIVVRIVRGQTVSNLTFYPMLRETIEDSTYVPAGTVPTLESAETHQSLFGKISAMFSNIRKLWNTIGTSALASGKTVTGLLGHTDISSVGSTVTGAINILNGKKVGFPGFTLLATFNANTSPYYYTITKDCWVRGYTSSRGSERYWKLIRNYGGTNTISFAYSFCNSSQYYIGVDGWIFAKEGDRLECNSHDSNCVAYIYAIE